MINLIHVKTGQIVDLKDGRTGTVTENFEDGQWIEVRIDGAEDEPELVHSQDIAALRDADA